MTGDEFRTRIERIYMDREKKNSGHGAVVWFGEKIGKSYSTLQRWIIGETPVPAYVDTVVELMEWQNKILSTTTEQVKT